MTKQISERIGKASEDFATIKFYHYEDKKHTSSYICGDKVAAFVAGAKQFYTEGQSDMLREVLSFLQGDGYDDICDEIEKVFGTKE